VLAYDPSVDPRLPPAVNVEMVERLDEMLRQAKVLCLVPELTDETRNLIGARELSLLPEGAVVVNSGRGQVLDLEALGAALDRGHLLAAGIDVVYPEPLRPDHPLLRHPKVTFSPHVAGMTVETTRRLAHSVAEQILLALKGEMPPFAVNPEAWTQGRSRRPAGR
jgi:phosphoglycerate dehydrogenase-like enzyme